MSLDLEGPHQSLINQLQVGAQQRKARGAIPTPVVALALQEDSPQTSLRGRFSSSVKLPRTRQSTNIELKTFKQAGGKRGSQTAPRDFRAARRLQKRIATLDRLADEVDDMKFSHSIQFNAVPDWSSHYISYSNLKKTIYTLEKEIHKPHTDDRDEDQSALLGGASFEPDVIFRKMLDQELDKICAFYRLKELEFYAELDHLMEDVESYKSESHGVDMDEVLEQESRRKATRST
ncbi:spx domain-containing protein, partial [Lasallia pustulata]